MGGRLSFPAMSLWILSRHLCACVHQFVNNVACKNRNRHRDCSPPPSHVWLRWRPHHAHKAVTATKLPQTKAKTQQKNPISPSDPTEPCGPAGLRARTGPQLTMISIACTIATPWKFETNIMEHQHEFPVILWSWGHHGSPISSEGTPNLFTNIAWNARWGSPHDVIDIGNPSSNARLCQPVPGACWQLQKFGGIHILVSEHEWKWGISPIYGHFRENQQI